MHEFNAALSAVVESNENRNTLKTYLATGSRMGRIRPSYGAGCIAIGAPRLISDVGPIYLLDNPVLCEPLSIPPSVRARLAVEAGATQGWHRYIGEWGDVIGLDDFAASAPGPVLAREYGFTVENVCKRAMALLEKNNA